MNSDLVIFIKNINIFAQDSVIFIPHMEDASPGFYLKHSEQSRSAIILENYQLQVFTTYANTKKGGYVIGKVTVRTDITILYDIYGEKEAIVEHLLNRLNLLISSGVFQLWKKWYLIHQYPQWSEQSIHQQLRSEGVDPTKVQPLSLKTNTLIVFYIYVCGCLFSIIGLFLEMISAIPIAHIIQILFALYRKCQAVSVYIFRSVRKITCTLSERI